VLISHAIAWLVAIALVPDARGASMSTWSRLGGEPVQVRAPADTVVRVVGPPVHPSGASLVLDLSIGVAEGADVYIFGDVTDISVGQDGAMYVVDRSVPAIRMYDAGGRFVRTIGGKGRGPGEYISPAALAVASDGRLLLWDPGNARINVYSSVGGPLTQWTVPSSGTSMAFGTHMLTVDSARVVYIETLLLNMTDSRAIRRAWIRLKPDGTLLDTLARPRFTGAFREITATAPDGRGQAIAPVPFDPLPLVARSPYGYFVTGVASRYAFEILDPRGILSIRRSVPPLSTSPAERESARATVTRRMQSVDPSWRWNGPAIPETKPAYSGLEVGLDGRIWVLLQYANTETATPRPAFGGGNSGSNERARSGSGGASCPTQGESTHDVFESNGRYLGQVKAPGKIAIVFRHGDYVWARGCDRDDAPVVLRFRIVWR
jgi:hypothetical protein